MTAPQFRDPAHHKGRYMSVAATSDGRRVHYGWVVVGTTFLTLLTTAGAMSTLSVLLEPLQKEFGWSTATVSVALSIRMAVFGMMAPFAAALMLRFGLRAVMVTSAVIVALGMLASAAVNAPWQLILLWGLVVGGGTGMTALVLGATVANRWFVSRRGLVIGIVTASSATGQLIFLPAYAAIDSAFGWRPVLYTVGVVMLLLVPLILWLMRDDPAVLGLTAYGESSEAQPPQHRAASPPSGAIAAAFGSLQVAICSRDFWLLSSGFFVCGLSTNGLIGTHLIAACSAAVAAYGAGLTRTVEGTYIPAFLTSGVLCIVVGLVSLFIGRTPTDKNTPASALAETAANA